jgi:hypothetical protein
MIVVGRAEGPITAPSGTGRAAARAACSRAGASVRQVARHPSGRPAKKKRPRSFSKAGYSVLWMEIVR